MISFKEFSEYWKSYKPPQKTYIFIGISRFKLDKEAEIYNSFFNNEVITKEAKDTMLRGNTFEYGQYLFYIFNLAIDMDKN